MPKRDANAVWRGSLREGDGTIALGSGAYVGAYSFSTRFEGAQGTNPEELIAGAHAGCFSMALSMLLEQAGSAPKEIRTKANVTLDKVDDGFKITQIELRTEAEVPGMDEAEFQKQAELAKNNCPISQLLTGAPITLEAVLKT